MGYGVKAQNGRRIFSYHTIVDSNDVVINFIVVRRQVKKNEKISIHRAIGGCEM